jgi:hypothetical protein
VLELVCAAASFRRVDSASVQCQVPTRLSKSSAVAGRYLAVSCVRMCALVLQLLHPQVTLQLCFLACCLLREAVTCYDIITWALDADLPFLGLPDIAKTCLSGATHCGEASVIRRGPAVLSFSSYAPAVLKSPARPHLST